MADGFDPRVVANAMIAFAARRQIPIWNVSIQKLLYFAHASYLARNGRPLIRGAFEAWEYGPVCRPIYDALKHYGRDRIVAPIVRRDPVTGETTNLPELHDLQAADHVDQVMLSMGRLTPNQLISLSHVPGGAWATVWNKSKTGATVGNRIDDALTVAKFGKLKMTVFGCDAQGGIDEAAPFAGD